MGLRTAVADGLIGPQWLPEPESEPDLNDPAERARAANRAAAEADRKAARAEAERKAKRAQGPTSYTCDGTEEGIKAAIRRALTDHPGTVENGLCK